MKAFFQRNPTFRRALTNILFLYIVLPSRSTRLWQRRDITRTGETFRSFPKVPSPSQQKSNWSNLVNAGHRVRVFEPSEWGGAKAVTKKSHSRLLVDITCKLGTSSFRGLQSSMSPATSSSSVSNLRSPFSGLIICVTGLSKEARKQVMDATERLGGQYSPHLHPRCTHLVVQISFLFHLSSSHESFSFLSSTFLVAVKKMLAILVKSLSSDFFQIQILYTKQK